LTFEELLEEFTGYKEPPKTVTQAEEITDVKEEQEEIPAADEEIQYYDEYDDYKSGEYKNYDKIFEKSEELTTLDEQVSLEEPVQKEWKVYERQPVTYSKAKRFREMLTAKDSIKDAIILKELLDPKYLEF
jgi:hypothetical protein